jgi:predicted acyltransferase (DUF342 family)
MATVPYLFAGQVGPIPLSELDANFANCKASATTANTVADAAQANITSVGTLTSLSVGGIISGGNLQTTGQVSATGNVSGGNLRTTGQVSAAGNVSGNTFVGNVYFGAGVISGTGTVRGGNLFIAADGLIIGNLTVQGTTTSQNSNTITTNDLTITVGNNQSTGAALNNGGLLVGSSSIAKWQFNNLTTSWQSNIAITPTANGTISLGGTSNYWGSAYITDAYLTGNIDAPGTVTAGEFLTGSTVSATGNVTGGNIRTAGQISATGNVTGGNIRTAGQISATGNVIAASVSVSGTIAAASIDTAGTITASAFNGSGAGLTGIAADLIVGNCGNALVANSVNAGSFTINETSGILYFSYNNITIATLDSAGNFTAKGNVTAFGTI